MLKCLLIALEVFGLTLGLGLILVVLRYVLSPLGRLIHAYWDWCSETFKSEFYEMLFSVAPVCALVFALLAIIVCSLGGK